MPFWRLAASTGFISPAAAMDGAGFKARLKLLGRTQVDFASETEVALRTVHNWAASGPPAEVRRLLDLLLLLERPFDLPGADGDFAAFDRQVRANLDRLENAAGSARRQALMLSIGRWLRDRSDLSS